MIGWLTTVEALVAAAAGVLCIVLGLVGRKPDDYSLGTVALVELSLLVQLVVALVAPLAGNHASGSVLEFFIYLVAALLIPVVAGVWALVERDRWSTVILGVGCLAVAVMVVRMSIIWTVQIA